MTTMQILTHRWKPKLVCLLLAAVLWYIIKQNLTHAPAPKPWPDPAAAIQSRK